jgi:hypothetical protein
MPRRGKRNRFSIWNRIMIMCLLACFSYLVVRPCDKRLDRDARSLNYLRIKSRNEDEEPTFPDKFSFEFPGALNRSTDFRNDQKCSKILHLFILLLHGLMHYMWIHLMFRTQQGVNQWTDARLLYALHSQVLANFDSIWNFRSWTPL